MLEWRASGLLTSSKYHKMHDSFLMQVTVLFPTAFLVQLPFTMVVQVYPASHPVVHREHWSCEH